MNPYHSNIPNELQTEGLIDIGIKELLEGKTIDWGSIRNIFNTEPDKFEDILFKIHFKRKINLPADKRSRIISFLNFGYLSTNDVRYFNEFLWFYRENDIDKSLMEDCIKRFGVNLNEKGQHRLSDQLIKFPVVTAGSDLHEVNYIKNPIMRVCLIGFPPFFGTILKRLKKEGHHVEQFYIPYHPDPRISRLLKFKILVKVLSLISGNVYSYRTLNVDYKDERIYQILKEGNFDIGFHKLNFIIKRNIFNAFKKGLLNDHWGFLPLMRGKSTIAYSVLLNIPVISTMHFIDEGIDSGPITGYFPYDCSKSKSVNEIRHMLRKEMPERAIAAIKIAGSNSFTPKENKRELGKTYYEIHPWLSNHIAIHILRQ